MNTCGTCRHWQPIDTSIYDVEGFGVCGKVEMARCGDERVGSWLACVTDASGYYAALKTRESFGCVLWEESE